MTLDQWATRWAIPPAAMDDLRAQMGMAGAFATAGTVRTGEAAVQSAVRLEAAQKGVILFRNNVGALLDDRGVPVRYGLANDSRQMNERIKSADLIGVRRVLIGPEHVGHTIGQFVSREIKAGDWKYRGDKRERAQKVWSDLILSYGGDAGFASGVGSL